jgi:TolB-like protein
MPDRPRRLVRFWRELRQRKVVQVIIVNASVAYVLIELANNVTDPLGLPERTDTLVIVLILIGFPIASVLSWIFDVTRKGIEKTGPIDSETIQAKDQSMDDSISRFTNSIVVLPFQDMSQEKDQGYFCDGITEEIINALTHIESLKVIARTSAFAFKDKFKDVRKIGLELNVETILEGSVRKSGNTLRISAQLIQVSDGAHSFVSAPARIGRLYLAWE